jgi:hypothetical protein
VLIAPIPPPPQQEDEDLPPVIDQSLPFTRATHPDNQPFVPVWSNEKWRNLTQDNELLECIGISGAREMGDWISGARDQPVAGNAHSTGQDALARFAKAVEEDDALSHHPPPPEYFWEPEKPYEDRSSKSDRHSSEDGTGIGGSDRTKPPSTMKLQLIKPGLVTLELTKTSLPVWYFGQTGARSRMETHTFVVITTVPKSSFVLTDGDAFANLPLPRAIQELRIDVSDQSFPAPKTTFLKTPRSPRQDPFQLQASTSFGTLQNEPGENLTPTAEIMAMDLPTDTPARVSRPLFFNRDGTVSRHGGMPLERDANGRSLDVHDLLKSTDWSKTSLGPSESWPQSLKTIGEPFQCAS